MIVGILVVLVLGGIIKCCVKIHRINKCISDFISQGNELLKMYEAIAKKGISDKYQNVIWEGKLYNFNGSYLYFLKEIKSHVKDVLYTYDTIPKRYWLIASPLLATVVNDTKEKLEGLNCEVHMDIWRSSCK